MVSGMDRQEKSELLDKWIAALRSGEYRQGYGALRNSRGEMCCLGVFRHISECKGSLYGKLLKAYDWPFSLDQRILSSLNDVGKSFDEIASIIDSQRDDFLK